MGRAEGDAHGPVENRLAIRVEDHGLDHLDNEDTTPVDGVPGAIAKSVWDTGTYEAEVFEDDRIVADFHGEKIMDRYAIFRTRDNYWLVHMMRDT